MGTQGGLKYWKIDLAVDLQNLEQKNSCASDAGCGFEKWVENGPDQIQHLAYTLVGYSAAAAANYLSVFCMPWLLGLLLIKGWHGILIMQNNLFKK